MKQFRKILFWLHLIIGLVAGGIIAIAVITGAAMSFEKQVVAWIERDIKKVKAPGADAERLSLTELTKKVKEVQPEAKPVSIVVAADPTEPVIFNLGRTSTVYLNPYTGEVQPQGAPKADEGAKPERKPMTAREMGSTVMGISATIFMLLSISGLYLWWPRSWSWKNVRAIVVPRLRENGKPRDWNWHNAFGFWASPIIIIMSFTGIVIAFHAVGDFIYKRPEGAAAQALLAPVSVPEPGTRPVGQDVLLANIQQAIPQWETITFRNNQRQRGGGENAGPQPVQAAVEVEGANLLPVQVQLDSFTGDVLRQESLGDYGWRRGFRTLNRTLHTGEAFGLVGQAVALLACLSGILLVYTGFALAFRRWRNWRLGKLEQNVKAESVAKQPMEEETAVVP